MKKLLLLSAAALSIFAVKAQSVKVTVEGNEVANGSTVISSNYHFEEGSYEFDGETYYYKTFQLDPEVVATSSTGGEYSITVTNTTTNVVPGLPNILFCWPTTCQPVPPGEAITQTGTMERNTPRSLEIDTSEFDEMPGFTTTCQVDIVSTTNSSDKFTCTIEMVFDYNGVNDIVADSDAPVVYYDLSGRRVLNPAKGQIVIERQGAKVAKKVIR